MSDTDGEERTLQVPEGLGGERVDVALARMFGISRSKAAELLSRELVHVDGQAAAKSDRLVPGTLLEVVFPARRTRWRWWPRWSRASGSSTTTTRSW